jgi:hypothetical protein
MMTRKQTEAERMAVMVREMERVKRDIAREQRTGKKRPIEWLMVDLTSGNVSPPPNVLRVVK